MLEKLTREIAVFNQQRLVPGAAMISKEGIPIEYHPQEFYYVEDIRNHVRAMSSIPAHPSYEWYLNLKKDGPGQSDPLFPWLAEKASLEDMTWFLLQESAGEIGFGDLVALTQIRFPIQAKLELARNYWDEMGQGSAEGVHDTLLRDLVGRLGRNLPEIADIVSETLLMANLLLGLASHRRYAYLSVGALGVIEMTAPERVAAVDKGLERLGFSKRDRLYFSLHSVLDIKHSRTWNEEIVRPLWTEHGDEIAEGAFLRLWAGERCFARYRERLAEGRDWTI